MRLEISRLATKMGLIKKGWEAVVEEFSHHLSLRWRLPNWIIKLWPCSEVLSDTFPMPTGHMPPGWPANILNTGTLKLNLLLISITAITRLPGMFDLFPLNHQGPLPSLHCIFLHRFPFLRLWFLSQLLQPFLSAPLKTSPNRSLYLQALLSTCLHIAVAVVQLFSCSVVSDCLLPCGLQHTMLPCPSPSPTACSNSCPSNQWCHPTILSSGIPFSSQLQSFPASESFLMSWLFASSGQVLELQLQHESFQWIFRTDFL